MILNSLSCILSYNYYDYKAILKDGKKKVLHQSTIFRQTTYFFNFSMVLMGLTVHTLYNDNIQRFCLVDKYGYRRFLGATFCYKVLGIGWGSFIGAWIINICFYAIHPSKGI